MNRVFLGQGETYIFGATLVDFSLQNHKSINTEMNRVFLGQGETGIFVATLNESGWVGLTQKLSIY